MSGADRSASSSIGPQPPGDLAIVSVTVLSFGGGLMASMVALAVFAVVHSNPAAAEQPGALVVSIFCVEVMLGLGGLLGAAVLGWPLATTPAGLARRLRLRPVSASAMLLVGVGVVGMNLVLSGIIDALPLDFGTLARLRGALEAAQGFELVAVVAAVTVLPAFGEELLFRGFVLRGWAVGRSARVGIWGSAALFGLVHVDPVQTPMAFVLGIYMGWVVVRTDSLVAGIAAHALNNGLASAAVWVDTGVSPLVWIALGLPLVVVSVLRLRRYAPMGPSAW